MDLSFRNDDVLLREPSPPTLHISTSDCVINCNRTDSAQDGGFQKAALPQQLTADAKFITQTSNHIILTSG